MGKQKDFDDALYCEFKNDRFRLDVAIADVSYWVEAESALDLDARDRGNSFYLANSVFPMLPERLSNDLCSLRPNEDRLAFVCRMEISSMGDILSSEFVEATICSAARLTYPQVTRFLSGDHEGTEDGPPEVLTNLEALAQVAELLFAKLQREGSVDFEFPEASIGYRDVGWIDNCWSEPRGRSTQIVEEAMLAANMRSRVIRQRARGSGHLPRSRRSGCARYRRTSPNSQSFRRASWRWEIASGC